VIGDILQPTHLLFVLVVALLVLGPKRLPEVARQLGSGLRDFKAAISGEDRHEADPSDHVIAPPGDADVDEHPDMSAFHDEPVQTVDPGAHVTHADSDPGAHVAHADSATTSDPGAHVAHADSATTSDPGAHVDTAEPDNHGEPPDAAAAGTPAATVQPVAPTDKPA
jgi:sec-independent protein translocase protein TatA